MGGAEPYRSLTNLLILINYPKYFAVLSRDQGFPSCCEPHFESEAWKLVLFALNLAIPFSVKPVCHGNVKSSEH